MTESVAVEKLDSPFQEAQQAADTAEQSVSEHTSICSLLIASGIANLAKELDNGNQQATQSNGTEAVCQGTLGRGASGILGEVVRVEVPGAIYASDYRVDRVLEPLGDPVHGECDKDEETNDLALTATSIGAGGVIVGRLVLDVDSDKGDRVPSGEGRSNDASDQTSEVDMAIFLANVDGGSKHESRKRDSGDPCPEAKCHE